jgi:hypothetical protein
MTFDEIKQKGVWPPFVIFTPAPLVIPIEVAGAFLDAVEVRGLLDSPENSPAPLLRRVVPFSNERRAELEAVLKEQMALCQASRSLP